MGAMGARRASPRRDARSKASATNLSSRISIPVRKVPWDYMVVSRAGAVPLVECYRRRQLEVSSSGSVEEDDLHASSLGARDGKGARPITRTTHPVRRPNHGARGELQDGSRR